MSLEYITLYKEESYNNIGNIGLEIKVSCDKLPLLKDKSLTEICYQSSRLILANIGERLIQNDKDSQEVAVNNKKAILSIFPDLIFSEEIPNGYCSDYCCKHLPWFIVTTKIGHFKIGWRKRVLYIDWSRTLVDKTAEEIFPDENVTKGPKYIHAWSIDDAKRYVDKIMENG